MYTSFTLLYNNTFTEPNNSFPDTNRSRITQLFIETWKQCEPVVKTIVEVVHFIKDASYKLAKEALIVSCVALLIFAIAPLVVPNDLDSVLLSPIVEEIIFRGVIQTALECSQRAKNEISRHWYKKEINEEELKAQKCFRVYATAILFGAVHLANPNPSLLQVVWCTTAGILYGFIKENTHSIAWPILLHSLNNANAAIFLDLVKNVKIGTFTKTAFLISKNTGINFNLVLHVMLIIPHLILDLAVFYATSEKKAATAR